MLRCHCGQPLHYSDPAVETWVNRLIREGGEYVVVEGADGRRWKVPRHYVHLHGILLSELPRLGFEQVK